MCADGKSATDSTPVLLLKSCKLRLLFPKIAVGGPRIQSPHHVPCISASAVFTLCRLPFPSLGIPLLCHTERSAFLYYYDADLLEHNQRGTRNVTKSYVYTVKRTGIYLGTSQSKSRSKLSAWGSFNQNSIRGGQQTGDCSVTPAIVWPERGWPGNLENNTPSSQLQPYHEEVRRSTLEDGEDEMIPTLQFVESSAKFQLLLR